MVLDRDAELAEADILEQPGLVERGLDQRPGRVGLVQAAQPRVERTGVDADPDAGAVLGRGPGDVGYLVVESLDVARVDAHLRAAGLDRREDVPRLEVDVGDDRELRLGGDRRQGIGIILAGHCHPDDVAAGRGQLGDLLQGRIDIAGGGGGHGLHRDGRVTTDGQLADLDLAGRTPRRKHAVWGGGRSSEIDRHGLCSPHSD